MLRRKDKTEKDVKYILDNLREDDIKECFASHGENWKEIEFNEIMSSDSYIVIGIDKNDLPVCMGGICEKQNNEGVVWFLSTDEIKKHKISMLKELKKEFEKFDENFSITYNFIYKNNFIAKNWLKWIGFKFDIPHPVGMNVPEGFEFFYRIRQRKGLI